MPWLGVTHDVVLHGVDGRLMKIKLMKPRGKNAKTKRVYHILEFPIYVTWSYDGNIARASSSPIRPEASYP